MIEQGPAPPVPTPEELIELLTPHIVTLNEQGRSDETDPDRVWLLRNALKNYIYDRDLENFAPQVISGIADMTGTGEPLVPNDVNDGSGIYDYTFPIFTGFRRKWVAIMGRLPNAVARPDVPDDESSAAATEAANNAAIYVRSACRLEEKVADLAYRSFLYATQFMHVDYVIDGQKYGRGEQPRIGVTQKPGGDSYFACPQCAAATPGAPEQPPANCANCGGSIGPDNYHPPTMLQVPEVVGYDQYDKGGLEITLHDVTEAACPLDARSVEDPNCDWFEICLDFPKGKMLSDYPGLRAKLAEATDRSVTYTEADYLAQTIRSAMASPIGLRRSVGPTRWTRRMTWWKPSRYQEIDDDVARNAFLKYFPDGVRITSVKDVIVELKPEKLEDHIQEFKTEPSARIMGDAVANVWQVIQDLLNDMNNLIAETSQRQCVPMLGDTTRINMTQWNQKQSIPAEIVPAIPPFGGSVADVVWTPPPVQFSEQTLPWVAQIVELGKEITGLLDTIWGGGEATEPTARQAELQKNAAMMQLQTTWKSWCFAFEKLYLKATRILAESQEGIMKISSKNAFGSSEAVFADMAALKQGGYHFECDDAIPQTWGQAADRMMWMLTQPQAILQSLGFSDPLNVKQIKDLIQFPGEHTPGLDDLNKVVGVIAKLAQGEPAPQPDGSMGPSIQPDWEDNPGLNFTIVQEWLKSKAGRSLALSNPQGAENVRLYGKLCQKNAQAPQAPPPPKASVAVALKGADLGSAAVQDTIQKLGLVDPGTQVNPIPPTQPKVPGGAPGGIPAQPSPALNIGAVQAAAPPAQQPQQ